MQAAWAGAIVTLGVGMTVDLLLTSRAAITQVAAVGAMQAAAGAICRERKPMAGAATPAAAAATPTPMTTRVRREETAGAAIPAVRTAPPSLRE
jgi:hypothetical protein